MLRSLTTCAGEGADISIQLVQRRDLNSLCLSCKSLKSVALPRLYETIELRIPLKWSRLPSLENLLTVNSKAFVHIRNIFIETKQSLVKQDQYGSFDESDLTGNEEPSEFYEDTDDTPFRRCSPMCGGSENLNAFIRLLILKIPKQRLYAFE